MTWVMTWKLLFDGGRNDIFDNKRCTFIKGDFSGRGNEDFS